LRNHKHHKPMSDQLLPHATEAALPPATCSARVESRWDWLVASTNKALPCGRVTVSLRLLNEVCQNAAVLHAWNARKRAEALALAVGACFEIHHDSVILQPNKELSTNVKD